MSVKAWALKAEKKTGWARSALMFVHLIKKNPDRKIELLLSSLVYFLKLFEWKFLLAVVHPLNSIRETTFFTAFRKACCKSFPFLRSYYYEVSMPVNLQKQHGKLFSNNFYLLKPLKVLQLNNHKIFITAYSGIVFKHFGIVRASIHGRWTKTRKTVQKNDYQQVMEAWFTARYDNGVNLVQLDDEREYLHVHHWFNYYHWLTETLARLWVVKDRLDSYVLILPESFQKIDFVQHSLAAMGATDIRWVKEGSVVFVPRLTLVQCKPYNNHYNPAQMKQMGEFFRNYSVKMQENIDLGERIFITRKNAPRRKMANEVEVEGFLLEHGFRSVALEAYTLWQEIAIMSKARYIIGIHGAGLTNMLFMPPGGRVLELHLEVGEKNNMHSDVYWKLAVALGHDYYYQFCKPANEKQNFFEADYVIDKKAFEENLKKFVP